MNKKNFSSLVNLYADITVILIHPDSGSFSIVLQSPSGWFYVY